MTIVTNKRRYNHDSTALNKEIDSIRIELSSVAKESQKQKSVVTGKAVNESITENVFHIDADGNLWIRTSAGLKQIQFV